MSGFDLRTADAILANPEDVADAFEHSAPKTAKRLRKLLPKHEREARYKRDYRILAHYSVEHRQDVLGPLHDLTDADVLRLYNGKDLAITVHAKELVATLLREGLFQDRLDFLHGLMAKSSCRNQGGQSPKLRGTRRTAEG